MTDVVREISPVTKKLAPRGRRRSENDALLRPHAEMSRKRPASARAFFCLAAIVAVPAEPVKPVSPLLDGLRNGCASGLATVCSKALLQPFDTIKTLQQGL